jgi:signal transduction histidine kinase
MPRKSQRSATGFRILVVDDQEEARASVRQLLEREGHTVLTAESGARALEVVREQDVHVALVDYFMPHMTGEQLVREIRHFDPFVQIILQTGYAGEKPARVMMAELEIQGYHDKADGPEKLLLWIDSALKAQQLLWQLRERERLQSELVTNLSHELRTPLHIIGGYTNLLIDGDFGALPADAMPPLHGLADAAHNLHELVEDFLHYAHARSGVLQVQEHRLSTAELAQELNQLGHALLDRKDVDFSVDLAEAPPVLVTDSVKLRTILRNLIVNAAKFTSTGAISVRIARTLDGVQLSVTDSGPGIPTHQQAAVFEPFRQLDGSITRTHRGIGLGLALSRKLAALLHGRLTLASTPGIGSTFTLTLPPGVADGAPPAGVNGKHLPPAMTTLALS